MATKVHVLMPHTTKSACGFPHVSKIATVRENVTCKMCKKSEEYKKLPNKN